MATTARTRTGIINTRTKPGHVALYIPAHGSYETTPEALDELMAEHLPDSVAGLRRKIQKHSDEEMGQDIDYSDLKSITECLFILAELHGHATN